MDHRYIRVMINRIWGLMGTGIEQVQMEDMMLDYCNYCSKHFHFEENMMIEHKYPGYREHRSRHKLMLDEFESMMLRLEVAKELSSEHLRHFVQVIAEHIQTEDKKMAAFVLGGAGSRTAL